MTCQEIINRLTKAKRKKDVTLIIMVRDCMSKGEGKENDIR
jgi:hypothetical protein